MKKYLFLAVSCLVALSSCNFAKPYTITGGFNVPEEFDLGDTIIQRGPLDGGYVYMLDLDGTPVDSALIEDETFIFEGKISQKDAYFAYIASDYAYGIIAVEPGDINLTIGQQIVAYGTPTNDAINDVDSQIDELAQDFSEKMMSYVGEDNVAPSDSIIMPIYLDFNNKCESLLDSLYECNKDNLVGIYIVNIKTSSAQTLEEFESMLEGYDEYITQSDVMNARRAYFNERTY